MKIEEKIFLYNEAMSDGKITDEEKSRLERAGITDSLREELQGKNTEEINDIFKRTFSDDTVLQNEESSWYKKLGNVSKWVLGAATGGFALTKLFGSKISKCARGSKWGILAGAAVGLVLGCISTFSSIGKKDKEISKSGDVDNQAKYIKILPAETDTIRRKYLGDNMAKKHGISLLKLYAANPEIKWTCVQEGQTINIPERKVVKEGSVTNLKEVAVAAGISESYINDILIGIEGRNKEPALKPYYDKVTDETHPKGYLTIGFGHTGRVHGQVMTEANMNEIEITYNEAHEILVQDLIDAETDAAIYFGEDFKKAPKSIQEAIVDIMFNKGQEGFEKEGSLTCKLKADLQKGDYVSAAKHVIYKTDSDGLKKRNIYRMIMATRDLSSKERTKVLDSTESYFREFVDTFKTKYPADAALLERAWQNARDGVCEGFFD